MLLNNSFYIKATTCYPQYLLSLFCICSWVQETYPLPIPTLCTTVPLQGNQCSEVHAFFNLRVTWSNAIKDAVPCVIMYTLYFDHKLVYIMYKFLSYRCQPKDTETGWRRSLKTTTFYKYFYVLIIVLITLTIQLVPGVIVRSRWWHFKLIQQSHS